MKTWQLLRFIFPTVLTEYYDIVNFEEQPTQLHFWMDEREFMEKKDYKKGTVRSYEFSNEKKTKRGCACFNTPSL